MTDHVARHPTRPDHCAPEDLSALVDDEVPAALAAKMESHLRWCASCRRQEDALAGVRGALSALETPVPAGAAHSAVALALEALREDAPAGASPDARAAEGVTYSLSALRRRQRRLRVVGIAAAVLLVAGVVTGMTLGLGQSVTNTAGSSSRAAGLHASAGKSAENGATGTPRAVGSPQAPLGSLVQGTLQLRRTEDGRTLEPPLAKLDPSDVASVRAGPGSGGSFTVTITLAAGRSLRSSVAVRLQAGAASAESSGRTFGTVHVLSPQVVEITGLTMSQVTELKRLLT